MREPRFIYWDANVFLSYLNAIPERVPVLEAILEAVEASKTERIVTSVISKVEVAWIAQEKLNRALDRNEETRIDALWGNEEVIALVDFNSPAITR